MPLARKAKRRTIVVTKLRSLKRKKKSMSLTRHGHGLRSVRTEYTVMSKLSSELHMSKRQIEGAIVACYLVESRNLIINTKP